MTRIDRISYYMKVADATSERSTCMRRKVGAVLTDVYGHILSTGYNGVPTKFLHCNDQRPCDSIMPKSGLDLDKCNAVHAEQNALLQCRNTRAIDRAIVTAMPCIHCQKILLNTNCKSIIFRDHYPTDLLWDRMLIRWTPEGELSNSETKAEFMVVDEPENYSL